MAAVAGPLGIKINLDAHVSELSLGEQQQVEIVRALLRDSRLLILDEATSMLTPHGVTELGALMRRLVERGFAVVFITHKLSEAADFGDRVSVLKLGRKVGEITPERLRAIDRDALVPEIVGMMFGRQAGEEAVSIPPRARADDRLLEVVGLEVAPSGDAPGLHGISFDVGHGEILGVAGIDGTDKNNSPKHWRASAQRSAAVSDSDSRHWTVLPSVRADSMDFDTSRTTGWGGDRWRISVSINFFLKQIGEPPFWKSGIERSGEIVSRGRDLVPQYDVRTPSLATPIGRLSGGNIQKVLIARELAEGARAVIFNKPTYGLDLANSLATRQRIRDIAREGMAVLLISTDLEELLSMCHRIAVISQGRLVGIVDNTPGPESASDA